MSYHGGCRICRSSLQLREEIEKLFYQKLTFRKIARKYQNIFSINFHLLEQSIGSHCKRHLPKQLTAQEEEFLKRVGSGEASFEEMANMVEKRVFENIIKNPEKIKLSDYLRLDTIRAKWERVNKKRLNNWDNEFKLEENQP